MRIYEKKISDCTRKYYVVSDEEYKFLTHWEFGSDENIVQTILKKHTSINLYINIVSAFAILASIIMLDFTTVKYIPIGSIVVELFGKLFLSFVISAFLGFVFLQALVLPKMFNCDLSDNDNELFGISWHIVIKILTPIVFGIVCIFIY